ncbi:MAG: 2-dehydro-3-deoxy-D-gluconate 5-dehydrogenase KduD [Trueperaceae bacterium]
MPQSSLYERFSLSGRVALVTGGATGIGQAVAIALAEAGADVAITVRRSRAAETEERVRALGLRFAALSTELSTLDADGAGRLMTRTEDELGPVDILVNNAGTIKRAPAAEHPESDWREVLSTNLDAVWYLSQAAGQRMLDRTSGGSIVNIASLLSFQGGINVPGYVAAKHGVAGLTKALANEWSSRGVNVNAIAPGYIVTSNTEALRSDPVRSKQILERIPAGRWGDPRDLAAAAVYLASPAAAYVHGHVLVVDGGWMAR